MIVAVDIEAIGRLAPSVFCVAFAADITMEPRVFFLEHQRDGEGTAKFWYGDEKRKAFYEKACSLQKDRKDTILEMRDYVDSLYKLGEVVWVSDMPEFDVGMVSSLFLEVGKLPLYLKDDGSPPADTINYNTYLRGLAKVEPTASSTEAYEKMGMKRLKRAEDHDAEKDIVTILKEAKEVFNSMLT